MKETPDIKTNNAEIATSSNIRYTYKDSALGKIPVDWDIVKLGKLVEIISGISPSLLNLSDIGKYPYLKVEDLNNCEKYQTISREYSSDDKYLVPKNSILFPKRGAAIINNKVRINTVAVQMDSNLMAIYPSSIKLNYEYLYYRIIYEKLYKIADTSSIPQINNKHILPYKFLLPPLAEQLGMAEILSTWDEAILTTTKLLAQKEISKKWLMQNLLTCKRRLKGFSEKWKEVKMKDVFTEIKDTNDGGDSHSIMTISARRGLISQDDKFNRVIAGDSLRKYTQLKQGDFAYNKGNSKVYEMGCIYQLEDKESALVPFVYICFSPQKSIFPAFYKQWFNGHGLDRQLKKIITSGARGDGLLNVNSKDFFNMKVPYPKKEEQTAIAEILQTADIELQLLKDKLEMIKEQKKGLMQILLTGKKQLKIN